MEERPKIADTAPIAINLKANEDYYWCRCGRSQTQPFCDGSHSGTSFTPLAFQVKETQEAHLCVCKYSKNPPYCDGAHATLPTEDETETQATTKTASASASAPSASNIRPTPEEPTLKLIHDLAKDGLSKVGHHGEMAAMGVPRPLLPQWDDIQVLTAQFATKPLMEDIAVETDLIIGPRAEKPLRLKIPLFVSDMSFGALSEEAKIALAKGAELASTGICSGEGGMLSEEQAANTRYFYELASAKFGYNEALLEKVQAFHFKGGQGAKTGTGGHLPANKVIGKIAEVRNLPEKTAAVSPPTFSDLETPKDFKVFSDRVREITGGIPIGMKMSANHIEADIDFAIQAGVDYIILDGRGGGTGAAPLIFRDNISVPTIPALARARHYLDKRCVSHITLIVTGGLRTPADFIKALCLGADGIAISNSAMQAIGCIAARMCQSNNCPVGIATQKPELRAKIDIEESAKKLARFFESSVQLMQVMSRACGHNHINQFNPNDITTWKKEMADLTGIQYGGFDEGR
ncbi:MAG: glutamate synthase-related protein [Nitrospirota bacterium]|nr:glutamate synthase-related protein [Nitrospirota bacterium]